MNQVPGFKHSDQETSITFGGDQENPLFQALKDAFMHSLTVPGDLPRWIRWMDGMSGKKYRDMMNSLIRKLPDARYLEIGSLTGSTVCAAMYGNRCTVTCIDNWSQFGGPKDAFLENTERCLADSPDVTFRFIECDFRKVAYDELDKANVFLYDGPHSEQDHFDGISLPAPCLDEEFILIVDDWVWKNVQDGTHRAFEKLEIDLVSYIEILTTQDGSAAHIGGKWSDWHNGYLFAVCRK